MKSQTRQDCEAAVVKFSKTINEKLDNGLVYYCGIAGDENPKGEYSPLFPKFKILTADIDAKWKPDLVDDISNSKMSDNSCDVIICVQVLEHVREIWKTPEEMYRILKPGGYAVVDCPFMYPYHAEPPSFCDFWRITRDGFEELFKKFEIIEIISTPNNTSCLCRKR